MSSWGEPRKDTTSSRLAIAYAIIMFASFDRLYCSYLLRVGVREGNKSRETRNPSGIERRY